MKTCTKCGEVKAPDDFHRNSRLADGRQVYCKLCIRAYRKTWKQENAERVAAVDWVWRQDNVDKVRTTKRRTREKHAAKHANYQREMNIRHPDKHRARKAVANAVASGKLTRPIACSKCGLVGPVHGHHDSYARNEWLAVRWLCVWCHASWHKANEAAA